MSEIRIKSFDDLTVRELYALLQLRAAVFVVEQNCVYQDVDDRDQHALHVWVEDERGVAACARVLPAGLQGETVTIGRVVARDRGTGLGRTVMQAAIETAGREFHAQVIRLESQCYAQGFYEKFGFRPISEPFMEEGIPHVWMQRG